MATDHRSFVALLAPIGVWSADGRRLVGVDWKGRVPAPVIDPGTRDTVGRIDQGCRDRGRACRCRPARPDRRLPRQGRLVLEVDLGQVDTDHVLDEDGDLGVEFRSGEVVSAWLGTTPAWPDVWLRLDETACADCLAPVGVRHADTCDMAGAAT